MQFTSIGGLLTEVMVASFCLQLFALVSPLFFQVVIDKVLVHRSMSTLDVLAIGLIRDRILRDRARECSEPAPVSPTPRTESTWSSAPGYFDTCLHCRSAIFRPDVSATPSPGFAELENIRNFLTSSALTLIIDLFFTIIFIVVMFFYSPALTWIVLGSILIYIGISAGATPLFQQRLDEKFQAGRRKPGLSLSRA